MPRGNDPDAAQDLQTQYAGYDNAEKLIQAHKSRFNRDLRTASLKNVDEAATPKLDLSKLQPKSDRKGKAISASKRGDEIVAVFEDESGNWFKDLADAPKSAAGSEK